MTEHPVRSASARRITGSILAATVLITACESRLPTSADLEQMDVKAAERQAEVAGVLKATHAEYLVDGKVVGTAPLPLEVYVEPGARTVEAKLAGYASAKETLAIEKGAARTVELTLVAAPVKAADASGANARNRFSPSTGRRFGSRASALRPSSTSTTRTLSRCARWSAATGRSLPASAREPTRWSSGWSPAPSSAHGTWRCYRM